MVISSQMTATKASMIAHATMPLLPLAIQLSVR